MNITAYPQTYPHVYNKNVEKSLYKYNNLRYDRGRKEKENMNMFTLSKMATSLQEIVNMMEHLNENLMEINSDLEMVNRGLDDINKTLTKTKKGIK